MAGFSNEIKKEDVQAFSNPLKGHLYYFPKGSEHAKCIEEGVIENFRIQVNRDEAQRETIRWVRVSNKNAERYRDGLTVEGMEIRGFKGWFVRNFLEPEDFMKPSFRKQSVDHTAKPARQGGDGSLLTAKAERWANLGQRRCPRSGHLVLRRAVGRSRPGDRRRARSSVARAQGCFRDDHGDRHPRAREHLQDRQSLNHARP